uniref:MULE transposase domain-containing protein n=1 Tax=Romanomermis culicivorax TaxID=13658 RepID=A0A915KNT3_ROMCU
MEQGPQIKDKFQFEIADRRLDQLSDMISNEFYLDHPILLIFGLNTGKVGWVNQVPFMITFLITRSESPNWEFVYFGIDQQKIVDFGLILAAVFDQARAVDAIEYSEIICKFDGGRRKVKTTRRKWENPKTEISVPNVESMGADPIDFRKKHKDLLPNMYKSASFILAVPATLAPVGRCA